MIQILSVTATCLINHISVMKKITILLVAYAFFVVADELIEDEEDFTENSLNTLADNTIEDLESYNRIIDEIFEDPLADGKWWVAPSKITRRPYKTTRRPSKTTRRPSKTTKRPSKTTP